MCAHTRVNTCPCFAGGEGPRAGPSHRDHNHSSKLEDHQLQNQSARCVGDGKRVQNLVM